MNVFNWYKTIDVYDKLFHNELAKKKRNGKSFNQECMRIVWIFLESKQECNRLLISQRNVFLSYFTGKNSQTTDSFTCIWFIRTVNICSLHP